jgi:hypothetical protein
MLAEKINFGRNKLKISLHGIKFFKNIIDAYFFVACFSTSR